MRDAIDITILLDKSGSMSTIADDTRKSVVSYIRDRVKDLIPATITLRQFNTTWSDTFEARPASEITEEWHYQPLGGTALFDALQRSIADTGARLRKLPESMRPKKVLFVVVTDGEENSSYTTSLEQVKAAITHQQDKYNWQFIFLGVGIDAFKGGMNLGFNPYATYSVGHNIRGTQLAFASASAATSNYSSGAVMDAAFTQDQYDEANKTGGVKNSQRLPK